MALSGKRRKFIDLYLGPCNFNATLSAKEAGYRCNSQHSFEQVGANILRSKEVREAIESYWQMSRMSAQEVLAELARLAKTRNHRDQLRALQSLGQYHGLWDHSWREGQMEKAIGERAEILAQQRLDEAMREIQADVDQFNKKAEKSNKEKERQWQDVIDRYEHSPIAVQAFTELRDIMLGKKEPPAPKPQPEIILPIPQGRRLAAPPIEKMLHAIEPEIVEPLPQDRCKHGSLMHECRTIEIGNDYCPHHYSLAPKQSRSSFRFS